MSTSRSVYRGLEPRAKLSFKYCSCIGTAHDSKVIEEVRDSGGVPMSCFPKVQYVLSRTGLSGEIVNIPANKNQKKKGIDKLIVKNVC